MFLMVSSSHAQWVVSRWEYSPLERTLLKIRHEPGTDISSLTRKENEALALLESHSSPFEQATIYSSIALSYSEQGWHGAEIGMKSAKYCEAALKHPVDAATSAQLYIYWADDISLLENHDGHLKGEALSSHRKKVTMILLKGLKVALDNLTQDKVTPVPGVMRYDCDGNCDDMAKEHAKQIEERTRVEVQNELISERDVFTRKIVSEYFPVDSDTSTLKRLAYNILTSAHSNIAQKILDDLATTRADWEKRHEVLTSTTTPKNIKYGRARKLTKIKDANAP